jgi:hypothetical protein
LGSRFSSSCNTNLLSNEELVNTVAREFDVVLKIFGARTRAGNPESAYYAVRDRRL